MGYQPNGPDEGEEPSVHMSIPDPRYNRYLNAGVVMFAVLAVVGYMYWTGFRFFGPNHPPISEPVVQKFTGVSAGRDVVVNPPAAREPLPEGRFKDTHLAAKYPTETLVSVEDMKGNRLAWIEYDRTCFVNLSAMRGGTGGVVIDNGPLCEALARVYRP